MRILRIAALLSVALAAALPRPASAEAATPAPKSPVGFVKGYTWGWVGSRGSWTGDGPAESMKRLAETGTTWIALAFLGHMKTKGTPEVTWGEANPRMVTDDEIRQAIRLARSLKLKVILKPTLDPLDGAWRGTIEFRGADGKDDLDAWQKWFTSYEAFQAHYAAVAQSEKVEMLCIGCEMVSTERFEKEWRSVAAAARKAYAGPLTYNTNWGSEEKVAWWDAVDVIGISAYYPVGAKEDTSLAKMTASWEAIRDRLRKLAARVSRPVLFIEIGVRSAKTCTTMPWDWSHPELPVDLEEQSRFYESALATFWNEPWFCGFAWWDWPARLHAKEKAGTDKGFCCYGKPAEQVLRTWYAKPRP
jgi:hypothetical protein